MYAHYFKSGKKHFVMITRDNRPIGGKQYSVESKRAARKMAADHRATPWNF